LAYLGVGCKGAREAIHVQEARHNHAGKVGNGKTGTTLPVLIEGRPVSIPHEYLFASKEQALQHPMSSNDLSKRVRERETRKKQTTSASVPSTVINNTQYIVNNPHPQAPVAPPALSIPASVFQQ